MSVQARVDATLGGVADDGAEYAYRQKLFDGGNAMALLGLVLLVIIGSSIWVAVDASQLGARPGALRSPMLDMTPTIWFFCCLLVWIIAFPAYVAGARPKLRAAKELRERPLVAPISGGKASLTEELERVHQLHLQGVLSAEEFESAKQRLLSLG
jgi:hypothetical protein